MGDRVFFATSEPDGSDPTGFSGFQFILLNEFNSLDLDIPAIATSQLSLVKWIWGVRSWTAIFSEATVGTRTFTSGLAAELDLVLNQAIWQDTYINGFAIYPVLNASGAYGAESRITYGGSDPFMAETFYNLDSISGDSLHFKGDADPSNTVSASPASYWPYANSHGLPVWDTVTRALLRDPAS